MAETVAAPSLFLQLKAIFGNLSPARLLTLFIILAGTVAGLVFLMNWATRPDYQYLYTNLTQEDAAAIVAQLKDKKVPYAIEANGTAVLVPRDQLYEVRLEMAAQGLPQGSGVGFEIFDNAKLGMTEFIQNVNYQRALQGELSRTINRFEEVEGSRVHIVIAPKSLFIEEEEPSTASVIVRLRRGHKLTQPQVNSIVHLVSSSVARLAPEQVTVVDNFGNMLAGFKEKTNIGQASGDQLAYQRQVENDLEDRVRSMLESVLGRNKAIVRVSCDLDFLQQEQTEEMYLPENRVVRSEQVMNETSNSTDVIPVGIPGLGSNLIAEGQGGVVPGGNQGFLRQDKTMNYEVGKVIKRMVLPVGSIKQMSVAVVVDGAYPEGASKGKRGSLTYVPRTPEEMAKIENLVKRAVNYDAERGDKVEVANISFETNTLTETVPEPEPKGFLTKLAPYKVYGKYLALGMTVMMVFFFFIRPLTRWITSTSPWDTEVFQQLPKTIAEIEREYAGNMSRVGAGMPNVNEASQLISRNQDRSVELVQNWLQE
jgi:flagellar M-ring protein FliF